MTVVEERSSAEVGEIAVCLIVRPTESFRGGRIEFVDAVALFAGSFNKEDSSNDMATVQVVSIIVHSDASYVRRPTLADYDALLAIDDALERAKRCSALLSALTEAVTIAAAIRAQAFADLVHGGEPIAEVARMFGTSESVVRSAVVVARDPP